MTWTPIKKSWRLQRLLDPPEDPGKINPGNFGVVGNNETKGTIGGFTHGELKDIQKVFSFEPMMAVEYERGDVPGAIEVLRREKLAFLSVALGTAAMKIPKYRRKEFNVPEDVGAYVICRDEDRHYIPKRVIAIMKGRVRLRDDPMIYESFFDLADGKPSPEAKSGWLELENPFMFFPEKEMFDNVRGMFNKGG